MYLLGSIHVLRSSDYPLAPAVLDAYRNAKSLLMEINLSEVDTAEVQAEMLSSAMLPEGKSLPESWAIPLRHAAALAKEVGVDCRHFDQFMPWFAAEAISQMQLMQLGFDAQSGVEMFFLDRARADGKPIAGLETVHDQIALFQSMPRRRSRIPAVEPGAGARSAATGERDGARVAARRHGVVRGRSTRPISDATRVYQSLLVARNRKWLARIEALLDDDKNFLVIVGTAHLVGNGSVLDLLKKDGIAAVQR